MTRQTITEYIRYFKDAFIINDAQRYDIKGKRYINSPFKYYFEDIGLRNARLNFRQIEETHIMENILYNELCIRGYNVGDSFQKIVVVKDDIKPRYDENGITTIGLWNFLLDENILYS